MKITTLLGQDHEAVLSKLDELEGSAELLRHDVTNNEAAQKIFGIKEFIETEVSTHFVDEETILYPALNKIEGMGEGPLKIVNYEHERFREIYEAFKEETEALRFGTLATGERLAESSKELVSLLRGHIENEDNVMFPMCERHLSSATLENMGRKLADEREIDHAAATVELDIRAVDLRDRHPLIFETFDNLSPGHQIKLVNDHDPKPLHYQFEVERQGKYGWKNLEQGPEKWVVVIRKVA